MADLLDDGPSLARPGAGAHEHAVVEIDDRVALRFVQGLKGTSRCQSGNEKTVVLLPPGSRDVAAGTPQTNVRARLTPNPRPVKERIAAELGCKFKGGVADPDVR